MELSEPLDQLRNQKNLDYYKLAGKVAAKVLDELVNMAKVGSNVFDLCGIGDKLIMNNVNNLAKDIEYKGVAFPTCISINNMAGFFSPNEDPKLFIMDGDIVKIELGVHFNGFPALVCFTVVINESEQKISDRRADVVKAAIEASKNVMKIMKPGKTNFDVMNAIKEAADKYNCKLPYVNENFHVPGVISYQVSQDVIDGYNDDDDEYIHRFIISRTNSDYEVSMRKLELEDNEVYAIDILMSTGSGKLTREDTNCTIFKRLQDKKVGLKLKASKASLSSFGRTRFPIHIRNQLPRFKLGLKECINNYIVEEYPPVREKKGEYVARIKFTVVVKDNPILIIGKPGTSELKKLA